MTEQDVSYPRISVVTCSYNQGSFLEDTIVSVVSQEYPDLEYIVVDGGSRDGSVEIIRKYESRLAWWVSEPDGGQSDALAKGFEKATGDILCWLCSDDMLERGALLEVGRFFLDHPDVDVVFGDTTQINREGAVTRRYKTFPFSRWLLLNTRNYIPQPSTFWRRQVYERVGGIDRSIDVAMDTDLWLRLSEVARFQHVPRYWSRMRMYPEIKSRALWRENLAELLKLEARYLGTRGTVSRWATRAIAKIVRIGYKVRLGCYWT